MHKPELIIFSISHYAEKARWALDYLGIEYKLTTWAPGAHMAAGKRMGLSRSSVPILVVGDTIVQGSSKIIDWAEQTAKEQGFERSLTDPQSDGSAMEHRLDEKIGVHLRCQFYSEALIEYPETVKPIFFQGLSWFNKAVFSMAWPVIQKKMIARMKLGAEEGIASSNVMEYELAWLNEVLSDGRPYLLGEQFTRVDLTASSLLAPLVLPIEHPLKAKLIHPPRLKADIARWNKGRVLAWVREIYAKHRN